MIDFTRDGHLATITLNRPEKKNAISHAMCEALHKALCEIDEVDDIWCGIITGAGGNFSSGHDLSEPFDAPGISFLDVYTRMALMTKPLIAAVEGVCYAQGAGIALLCDIIVAHTEVLFGWPQVTRGIGSVSGPAIFARMVPRPVAAYALFTGRPVTAGGMCQLGLVDVVPSPLSIAQRHARDILANAPLAVQAMKHAMRDTAGLNQISALFLAHEILGAVVTTEDAQEGLRAFQEKRAPVWTGR